VSILSLRFCINLSSTPAPRAYRHGEACKQPRPLPFSSCFVGSPAECRRQLGTNGGQRREWKRRVAANSVPESCAQYVAGHERNPLHCPA
jgi:hypothetical protein